MRHALKKTLRIMRTSLFFLLVSIIQAQAISGYAQKTQLSLDFSGVSIERILNEIESRSEYYFLYNKNLVDVKRNVDIHVKNRQLDLILDQLFGNTEVKYRIFNRQIVLSTDENPLIGEVSQSGRVTGKVTDSSGNPLPGVTVMIKESSVGTITDADGRYSISNVADGSVLVFSFVGMRSSEVEFTGQNQVDVQMEEETVGLEEVVAIGYGTVKKSDLTGAVSSVKAEDIQNTPLTSIDQGLVGRASGVMVTQTSGMPGAIASIRVRGTSSLQGGNEPLYVIDGFPVYNGSGFGSTGGRARMSGLATINPSDIESIEILKDASATSIYGSRAANGVVLITTKSGKHGLDKITVEANYGIQSVVKTIDVMNAYEYAQLVNEAYTNDGLNPVYDEVKMAELRQNPKGTDWQDELFRTAPTQNYQITFSGGTDNTIYSVSANYYSQEGVIRNSDFDRYSGRVNLERKMFTNFRTGTHLNLSRVISNVVRTDAGDQNGVITGAMKFNPILPVFSNEEFREYTQVNSPGIVYPNPVATADEQVRKILSTRLLGDVFGEWEVIPDLKAKVSFGVDLFDIKNDMFTPSTIYESGGTAQASVQGNYHTTWLNENTLSWSKRLKGDQSVSALAGITFQRNHTEGMTAASRDFVNNVLEQNSLQSGAVYDQPSSNNTEWSLLSYIGRINYNLKDKYLLTFSSRVDGSSRFGKNNKYAFFPSGSLAWRASEEDFVQELGIFSNMKLRTSYGVTGNQEIGLYNSLPTLTNTTYTIGRALVSGFYPNTIPNPDLKWEKTSQFDVGLDLAFLENKLRITTDYYHKKTTDLIYDVAVPFTSGFSATLKNIGSMENYGVELSIDSDNLNGVFGWTTNFNISFNRNKVLELGGESYKDVGTEDGHLKTGLVHRLIVGEPIGLFYGYVFDGLFKSQEELGTGPKGPTNWLGGRRYKDISGPDGVPDGKVDATYDRTVIGDPNPEFFGGMANTFSYKGIELNVFMQYSYGNDIFNYNAMELELPAGGQNVYRKMLNRWSTTNQDENRYPKATTNRSAVFCSEYIEDGSYLKVKTVTLAYTFPNLKSRNIAGLKIYATCNNLLTFTKYRGYDPEVSYKGASSLEIGEDFGGYPQAKIIMFGVNLDIK